MIEKNINKNIDFIGNAKIFILISCFIIISGILSLIIYGGPKLSIDFTGGTVVRLEFSNHIEVSEIRSKLQSTDLKKSEITQIIEIGSAKSEFRIKTNINQKTDYIHGIIKDSLKEYNPIIRKIERVGPKIGNELQTQAVYAISLALVMLMIYIGFRFDRFYALGSVVAIIHDVLFTLGIFSILRLEIDLSIIAAFLTIVGYSLNDTIVIFDRFRENTHKDLELEFNELANLSLNQTLSRTIITSLTTLMVVTILFYIGGEVIRYFSLALIIGVLVGTYSSIFIASPFMLFLKSKYKIEEE